LEITPLGFESLGARSQATLVETKDVRVLIDPAVSLAPRRFGLPPHQLEVDALTEIAKRITEVAKDVDVIVVTHYHYDHHDPGWVVPKEIYSYDNFDNDCHSHHGFSYIYCHYFNTLHNFDNDCQHRVDGGRCKRVDSDHGHNRGSDDDNCDAYWHVYSHGDPEHDLDDVQHR